MLPITLRTKNIYCYLSIYLYLCAFIFSPPVSFSILALWFSLMADEGLALLLLKKEQRAV